MSNLVGKLELIREISRYHPGYEAGRKRGWSWYVGGMRDDGGWNFWKMYDAGSYADLRLCLQELELEANPKPIILSEKDRIKANTLIVLENGQITNELEKELLEKHVANFENNMLWGKRV